MPDKTETLDSYLGAINALRSRWAEIQAESNRIIKSHRKNLGLTAHNTQELANDNVELDCAAGLAILDSETIEIKCFLLEQLFQLPTHNPPIQHPKADDAINKRIDDPIASPTRFKIMDDLLQSQLMLTKAVFGYPMDEPPTDMRTTCQATTQCLDTTATNRAETQQPPATELAAFEHEMLRIVESYPAGLRVGVRSAMHKILRAKAPFTLEDVSWGPWVIRHPWERTPEGSERCSERTVGGLILLLYELVGLAGVGYVPVADALGVVERLMSAIPQSTFHQVSVGYGIVWEAFGRARFKAPELKNLLLYAIMGLGELISARFKNLRRPSSLEKMRIRVPKKDLVAGLPQVLTSSEDNDEMEEELANRYNQHFRRFTLPELNQDVGIVADSSHDYVLILEFAKSSILLAHKSYARTEEGVFSPWEGALPDLVVRSPLQTANSIYIAVSCEEEIEWWNSSLSEYQCRDVQCHG
ncbi:hypothetical protein N658DRAFT_490262 [Parathielavia hyrcaniae]|uniref:Uncharacterized protein n=1 Tax=Parathielavia hyrcaniae TaxID=113614 RepID=A0AAN6PQE0_9PEZI|nr:hypothetical protein N658DRAFT_490262 [Parathielavia hyrcaniae]